DGAGSGARLAAVAPVTPRARATDAAATRMPAAGPTRERAERFPESAKRLGARRPGPLLGTPFLERLLRLLLRQLLGFVGTLHGQSLAAEEAGQRPREECTAPALTQEAVVPPALEAAAGERGDRQLRLELFVGQRSEREALALGRALEVPLRRRPLHEGDTLTSRRVPAQGRTGASSCPSGRTPGSS